MEYIAIATYNDKKCVSILDGIDNGLNETKKWKRKQLKIEVNVFGDDIYIDIKNILCKLKKIILRLESLNINDFMFIWSINKKTKNKCNDIDILKELKDISSNIKTEYGNNMEWTAIINNVWIVLII